MKRDGLLSVLVLGLFVSMALSSLAAEPDGADVSIVNASRRTPQTASSISALGGNVSQLNIFAYSTTQSWQAYYGNVTGRISLGDSIGNALFDWYTADPSGQVFASTSQVDFSDGNVECYNFSRSGIGYFNLSEYEESLSMSPTSADGINETFNETEAYEPFWISTTYINQSCPVAYLYNASNTSSRNTYQELLLYDNTAEAVIFTSIIRQGGIIGFDGNIWDFQMIVAENGRDNEETTEYFFYVSLE